MPSLSPEERAAAVLHYHAHSPYALDYLIADAIHAAILAERERAARIAARFFVDDPYALHPDIPFDAMNETAQTAAHSTAQSIAARIRAP